jgi:hypothetical protein
MHIMLSYARGGSANDFPAIKSPALNDYPLGLYDLTVEIVTFEPDQEIAWTVRGQLDLGHVHGYRLEAIEEGTLVTSYYDWSAAEQSWKDPLSFR